MAQVQRAFLDHLCQLAGGQYIIHVLQTIGYLGRQLGFVLLGDTGHDPDHNNILGVDPHFLGIVGLGHRAGHLHRRLAGRGHVLEVGELILQEVDPTRAAGGQDRQFFILGQPVHDLVGFFDDGQISTKGSIENSIESKAFHGSHHLAGNWFACRKTELFSQCHTDSRGYLGNHNLFGIEKRVPGFSHISDTCQCRGWANTYTLAAEGTVGIDDRFHLSRSNHSVETASESGQGTHSLDLVAHGIAAAAHDAFVRVTAQRAAGLIHFMLGAFAVIALGIDPEFPDKSL